MKNKIKERVLKETKEYACPKCEVDTDGKILPYWSDEGSSCDKWENHIEKTIDLTLAEVGKVIDDVDLELFLEDVIDKETGKKVVIPKEVWELWNIYWEHIQEKLKQKLGIK